MRRLLLMVASITILATGCSMVVEDALPGGVSIECDGSTGMTGEACAEWGNEILELGAPSNTFELEDVTRLRVSKPLFGLGSPCTVEYFLQRYPDDAVWDEDLPCKEG